MNRQKEKEFNIRNEDVRLSINKLDGILRAEYNISNNYLDYYAGQETLEKVGSIKYQVLYGRRGTGKTHLLKALQEKLIDAEEKYLPVYIDLRAYKPMLANNNDLYYALILFQEIIVEILKSVYENIEYLYKEYLEDKAFIENKKRKVSIILEKFNRHFNGQNFSKIGDVGFRISEVRRWAATLNLTKVLDLSGKGEYDREVETENTQIKYISFSDMSDSIAELLDILDVDRIFCLIDEWSEIPESSQYILAEFIKRAFITRKITVKIAAIPNRTKLLSEERIGLEDGGDIFGYNLDDRYIYELNPDNTKVFFNELLFKQLYNIDPQIYQRFYEDEGRHPVHNFINKFLANQALREILIASAGIPRDFLNIFISAYNYFYKTSNKRNKHLVVADVRKATIEWYKVDKKKTVDANSNAKLFLEKIIDEILISKKRCHFLIPEKYEMNKELNDLIDLRVIHLRKKGISHKGRQGIIYNVYYLDYACYTSSNYYHNRINTSLLSEIEATDNFREIRRVSLEDNFFEAFNMEIGDSIKCPKCGKMINIKHPAYVKQKICHHCYEKIDEDD